MTGRARLLGLLAVAALIAGGCVPSRSMHPGEMDQLWAPAESKWAQAQPYHPSMAGRQLPYRYEVAYEPSETWSLIALNKLAETFPSDRERIVFPVSTQISHAWALRLADMAQQVHEIGVSLETIEDSQQSLRHWADATARLIGDIHAIYALSDPTDPRRHSLAITDAAAWGILPLLEVMTRTIPVQGASLSERLALLDQGETGLVRVVVTASFRIAGRKLQLDAVRDIMRIQRTERPRQAFADTRNLLLCRFRETPRRYEMLPQSARGMANWSLRVANGMRYLASLSSQWKRMDYLALEFRTFEDQRVVALEFHVREGQRVTMNNSSIFAPDMEFSGYGRVIFQQNLPKAESRDERSMSILFESADDGKAIFRFNSPLYLFVRLLAFPLNNAQFKQLKIDAYHNPQGEDVRRTTIMMESVDGGGGDARRVLEVETIRRPELRPRQSLPPQLVGITQTRRITYANGRRIWQILQHQLKKPELWRGGQ